MSSVNYRQLDLMNLVKIPIRITQLSRNMTARDKFEQFHMDNPHVYEMLRSLALRAKRANQKVGMRGIYERLRWEALIDTNPTGEDRVFKINNNHTPFYARLLMDMEPELENYFKTRSGRNFPS